MRTNWTKGWVWAMLGLFWITFSGHLLGQAPAADGIRLRFTFSGRVTEDVDVRSCSILLVDAGSYQYLLKPETMDGQQATIRAVKCAYNYSAANHSFTLNRLSTAPATLTLSHAAPMGGAHDGIQVAYLGVMAHQAGNGPIGACKAVCCEATCFTVSCCLDNAECRNAKCDCKPSGQCPQSPSPGGTVIAIGGHTNFPPISAFTQLYGGTSNQLTVPEH